MDEFIPIKNILEENSWIKELEQKGYIIKPEKIDAYLDDFKTKMSASPNKNYWSEKRIIITGIS